MIFSIRGLGFELGSLLLEGWAAFAARVLPVQSQQLKVCFPQAMRSFDQSEFYVNIEALSFQFPVENDG